MFYKYEIRKNKNEEVLYLFLSTKYEFSEELNYDDDNICVLSRNFINSNKIPFKGNTVFLVVDDIITKKIDLSKSNHLSDDYYLPDSFLINLKLEDSSLCEITLREYLLSVLFSKYSNELGDEVLKSICILYNTFCFKSMSEDKFILANNNFVNYKPNKEFKNNYKNYEAILTRLNRIINECSGMYICYDGVYILPFIHYSNSGRTLSNTKYPYLTSVKSLWDLTSNYYISSSEYSFSELNRLFDININSNSKIEIKNDGKTIMFDKKSFSIYEVKNILNLSSNDISIIINKNSICFVCKGLGNGYGLSIYGATYIEANGGKYNNILGYYFPKCQLFRYIKRLS